MQSAHQRQEIRKHRGDFLYLGNQRLQPLFELEIGVWKLEFGNWRLEIGVWNFRHNKNIPPGAGYFIFLTPS